MCFLRAKLHNLIWIWSISDIRIGCVVCALPRLGLWCKIATILIKTGQNIRKHILLNRNIPVISIRIRCKILILLSKFWYSFGPKRNFAGSTEYKTFIKFGGASVQTNARFTFSYRFVIKIRAIVRPSIRLPKVYFEGYK